MISDITRICMVSLQYGFSCAYSDDPNEQMFSDITDICMVSLQYGLSYVFSDTFHVQMISDITDICTVPASIGYHVCFQVTTLMSKLFLIYLAPAWCLTKFHEVVRSPTDVNDGSAVFSQNSFVCASVNHEIVQIIYHRIGSV